MDMSNLTGIKPKARDVIKAQAKVNIGDITLVIPEATKSITAAVANAGYTLATIFELQAADGTRLPFEGTAAASVAKSSSSGTATVTSATPAVSMGRGYAGATMAGTWVANDTMTLTVTWTDAFAQAHSDTCVVTVTA